MKYSNKMKQIFSFKKDEDKKIQYDIEFIKEIQPIGGISFCDNLYGKYTRNGNGYVACINIYDYPKYLNDYWLSKIIKQQNTISVIDIGTIDTNTVKININKSLIEQEGRIRTTKDNIEQRESRYRYQELDELYDEVAIMGEVVKKLSIRIYISADTIEEIEKRKTEVIKYLESESFKSTIYLNENKYEWLSIFESLSKQEKMLNKPKFQPMQTKIIASGNPFHYTSLKDEYGTYLGYTTDSGGCVLFDQFKISNYRTAYDSVIFGKLGTGKSTLLKKMMLDRACRGDYIRGLEVDGGFKNIIGYLGGKILSLDGTSGILNPFQILKTNENNEICFSRHIAKMEIMYKFLVPQASNYETLTFGNVIKYMYHILKMTPEHTNDVSSFKNNQYPTLSDFSRFLNEVIEHEKDNSKIKILNNINIVIENLINNYKHIFDGHTSIPNVMNEQILFFDIATLKNLKSEIFEFQLFNALTLLWDNCLQVGKKMLEEYSNNEKDLKDITHFYVVIDEAHKIANTSRLDAVDQLVDFKREARKYFGSLNLATQSIRDMIPESSSEQSIDKLKTLFELSQYKFIFNQDSSSLGILNRAFNNELSNSDLQSIPKLSKGQCLLSLSSVENLTLKVDVTKEEKELFMGGA